MAFVLLLFSFFSNKFFQKILAHLEERHLGMHMPFLTGKVCDIFVAVDFDHVRDDLSHSVVVILEYGREVSALSVYDKYRSLIGFAYLVFETFCEIGSLKAVLKYHDTVILHRIEETVDVYLCLLTVFGGLIFSVHGENAHIEIIGKSLFQESVHESFLMCLIDLSCKQCDPFSLAHRHTPCTSDK